MSLNENDEIEIPYQSDDAESICQLVDDLAREAESKGLGYFFFQGYYFPCDQFLYRGMSNPPYVYLENSKD